MAEISDKIDKKEFPDRLVDMVLEMYKNVFDRISAESFKGAKPEVIRAFASIAQQFMFLGASAALEYVTECLTNKNSKNK